jgi:hypothetical protein
MFLVVLGCASAPERQGSDYVECSGFWDSDTVVQTLNPIRRCYIQAYDPEVWGRMSASSWLLAQSFATTYPNTLAPLTIVNGFISSMSADEAAVLARIKGIAVYECGRSRGVSDLDAIVHIQIEAEKSERKVPQPEALRIPSRTDGAVTVAVCSALNKIQQANIVHGVEWRP